MNGYQIFPRQAIRHMRQLSKPQAMALVASCILLIGGGARAQNTDDFQTHQSGNWNSTATWERWNGSAWITPAPATPTSANGAIAILNGHTVTVTANVTVDQVVVNAGGQVTLNAGTTLTIANGTGTDVTVSGIYSSAGTTTRNGGAAIAFTSGSTYQHTANGGTIPTATWDANSTCLVTGTVATLPGGLNQTFGDLTWNCAGQTNAATLGSVLTLNGDLTIQSTGATGQFRFASGSSSIAGGYMQSGGSVRVGAGSNRTVTVGGDLTMSAGSIDMSSGAGVGIFNVGGNFSHTGGTINESGTSTTSGFVFNGTGTQAYTSGGTITNAINFTVNSGAALSMGTSVMSGAGTFTLASGATLALGSPAGITASGATGNIQVTGTRSYAAGANYTFDGSSAQATGNGLPAAVNALTFNNAAGVALGGDVQIAGSMTVTGGDVSTAGHTLTISATAPGALTLGANRITGTVARAIAPGSTGTYRFFDANAYVIPGGTGNPSMITATVYPNTNPPNLGAGADTNVIVKRYYTINATGIGGGFFYTLRLSYAQSEVRGNEATYTMWENSGVSWVDVGVSSAPDTAANFTEQGNLTGFSDWMLAANTGALPIQLASFQGAVVAHSTDVRLTWTTLSELNNYGFYVQRSSAPSSGFADCANNFVRGSGTSLTVQQYAWTEKSMTPGTYYYRLKQVDLDGSFTVSEPVKVVVETPTGVDNGRGPEVFALSQNYPNPFNPATRIEFSVAQTGNATLIVYNILGDQVGTLFTGTAEAGRSYTVAFDGSNLANGAYFCRLTSGGKTELRKMLLLK